MLLLVGVHYQGTLQEQITLLLGLQCLEANTEGSNNTAVGKEALDANTTAQVIIQQLTLSALGANTTGERNTAVGANALFRSNTTASNNV